MQRITWFGMILLGLLIGIIGYLTPSQAAKRQLDRAMEDAVVATTTSFTSTIVLGDSLAFTDTQSMHYARSEHRAITLQDGKVLIAGGHNLGVYQPTAEIYDPSTDRFTTTGTMIVPRSSHASELLADGRVLFAGGYSQSYTNSAELYNPATGTFQPTGALKHSRAQATATRLLNGKILVVGGWSGSEWVVSAELYDPVTGTFTETGSLNVVRMEHTATLLPNGKVLIAGGADDKTAEIYNPATGTFTMTGLMAVKRKAHSAILLNDGRVLIAGGLAGHSPVSYHRSAELYDPESGAFTPTDNMQERRILNKTVLLSNGKVLLIGNTLDENGNWKSFASAEMYAPLTSSFSFVGNMQQQFRQGFAVALLAGDRLLVTGGSLSTPPYPYLTTAEIGIVDTSNTFSVTLTLPDNWLATNTGEVGIHVSTLRAQVNAGALSNDGVTWGDWFSLQNNQSITTTWQFGADGPQKPIYLRLRDSNGRIASGVVGRVNVDTVAPTSTLQALPPYTNAVLLSWTGTDATSGIAGYDVQARSGPDTPWSTVISNTQTLTATFSGVHGTTYAFRVRAIDQAGNVEPWPDSRDAVTIIDTVAPSGTLVINRGSRSTPARQVLLDSTVTDDLSGTTRWEVSNDNHLWWSYTTQHLLSQGDGLKTVYLRVYDRAGNVSAPISSTIVLDQVLGAEPRLSINAGALFVNTPSVTLTVGAVGPAVAMQISNDGGFAGAVWVPFDTRPSWKISTHGSYVLPRLVYVRVLRVDGTFGESISEPYSDDIIYDPVPPEGSISATMASPTTVLVQLGASDAVSGLGHMRVGLADQFSQAAWEPYAANKLLAATPIEGHPVQVHAEFRDLAGNISTRICGSTTGVCFAYRVTLPLLQR